MNNILYLSKQQWHNRIKTIETKNLKKFHTTPSYTSIERKFNNCIIEIQDGDTLVVNQEKYNEIRNVCLSEEFAMRKSN